VDVPEALSYLLKSGRFLPPLFELDDVVCQFRCLHDRAEVLGRNRVGLGFQECRDLWTRFRRVVKIRIKSHEVCSERCREPIELLEGRKVLAGFYVCEAIASESNESR